MWNQFHDNQGDSRKIWKTVKSLGIPSNFKSQFCNIDLNLSGQSDICFEKSKVAQEFNDSFINVAKSLVENLPNDTNISAFNTGCVNDYYNSTGVMKNSFKLCAVSEDIKSVQMFEKSWQK